MKHFLHSPKFVLPLLAAVIFFARLHTYFEPIDMDVGVYAVLGHEMLNGKQLYKDMGDQKPPGIHFTYAVAELIAGYGRGAIFLLTVCASISTLCAIYCAGAVFGPVAAFWAAVFWTIVSGDLALEGNQPNAEVFINSLLTWGLVVLLRQRRQWSPWVTGLCFAAATLYKHSLVVTPALLCAAYVIWPFTPTTRMRALSDVAIIAAVGLFAWSSVIGYFAWTGQLLDLKQWVVDFNQSYVGSLSGNLTRSLGPRFLFPKILWCFVPMLVVALAGAALAIQQRRTQPWFILFTLAVATQVGVAVPGSFFPHYYQLWLPFVTIGGGWGVSLVVQFLRGIHVVPAMLTGPAVVAVLLAFEVPNYLKSPIQWSVQKYGDLFVDAEIAAAIANKHLAPNETIYQLGCAPQIYMLTGRRAPRVVFAVGYLRGPLVEMESRRLMEDFEQNAPDLVVLQPRAIPREPDHPLATWFKRWLPQHYALAPGGERRRHFAFLVRKGSDLEHRWQAQAALASMPTQNAAATNQLQ